MDECVTREHSRRMREHERVADRLEDWRLIGGEFAKLGVTRYDIARALAVPRSTVDGWFAYNMEPRYSEGRRVIWLHQHLRFGKPLPEGVQWPGPLPRLKAEKP